MKLTIDARTLSAVLKQVSGSVSSLETKPILKCVHFSVNKAARTLKITATDIDITTYTTIAVNADDDAVFVLPASEMKDFVSNFENSVLEITVKGTTCTIVPLGTEHVVNWNLKDHTQFPQTKVFDLNTPGVVEVSRSSLLEAVEYVFPARCTEAARQNLVGIDISQERVLAADGKVCLSHKMLTTLQTMALTDKASSELVTVLNLADSDMVKILRKDDHVVFDAEGLVFYTKVKPESSLGLMDSTIVRARSSNTNTLTLDVESFKQSIAVARLVTGADDRRATFEMFPDRLKISSSSKDGSTAKASMESTWTGVEGFKVTFNLDWLAKGVEAVTTETGGTDLEIQQPKPLGASSIPTETSAPAEKTESTEGVVDDKDLKKAKAPKAKKVVAEKPKLKPQTLVLRFAPANNLPMLMELNDKVCLIIPSVTTPPRSKATSDHREAKSVKEKDGKVTSSTPSDKAVPTPAPTPTPVPAE